MKIFTKIIGNIHSSEWAERASGLPVLALDRWTAQKSRLTTRSACGEEYGIALDRHSHLADGDIVESAEGSRAVVRIEAGQVMVADLAALRGESPEWIIRSALELGHAIGNQHWPAVVKGTRVYVPLTVDRKVMASVMQTHRIEGVTVDFVEGGEVIPYLAPHEVRRLFGGAEYAAGHHKEHHAEHHARHSH